MNPFETILPTLASYLVQGPILLVWLVGFILALVYWRRHPRVSLLTVIALLIFLGETLAGTYLNLWLPLMLTGRGVQAAATVFLIKSILTSLILAIAWALLVAAIFGWRRAASQEAGPAAQASPAGKAPVQQPAGPGA